VGLDFRMSPSLVFCYMVIGYHFNFPYHVVVIGLHFGNKFIHLLDIMEMLSVSHGEGIQV